MLVCLSTLENVAAPLPSLYLFPFLPLLFCLLIVLTFLPPYLSLISILSLILFSFLLALFLSLSISSVLPSLSLSLSLVLSFPPSLWSSSLWAVWSTSSQAVVTSESCPGKPALPPSSQTKPRRLHRASRQACHMCALHTHTQTREFKTIHSMTRHRGKVQIQFLYERS